MEDQRILCVNLRVHLQLGGKRVDGFRSRLAADSKLSQKGIYK